MKEQLKVPAMVAIIIVTVAVVLFFGSKAMSAGDLDQGQVKYTPGKPPWQETDPEKRASQGSPTTAPPPQGAPPGLTAPVIGNGGH